MEPRAQDGHHGTVADPEREAVLGRVAEALDEIEYGSVLIKIHQGKVVGIETSTKLRLNP
jgi:hypothetical protein